MDTIDPIFRQSDVASICTEIDKLGRFAIDLEFIPEKTYNPVLALLQIATDNGVYIIDPLADLDLHDLWQRIADEHIVKVLHAAKEDLNIIRQLSGLVPKNIFDTQLAAGFLGYGYPVGYKKLLSQVMNVQIDKSESFTDWLIRPLSKFQLRYAFEDVCHLLSLADQLRNSLDQRKRLVWVVNECACSYTGDIEVGTKNYGYTKIKGARNLSRQKLAVLQALCELRTEEAKRTNRPLKTILSDITLLELSKKIPKSIESFEEIRGINIDQARRHGKRIIASIEKALSLSSAEWPNWPSGESVSDAESLAGDVLYAILKVEAYKSEIAPELLATRNDIQKLVRAFWGNCHDETELSVLSDWRNELIGKKLLNILKGMPARIKIESKEEQPIKISFD